MLLKRLVPLAVCLFMLGCKPQGPKEGEVATGAPLLLVAEDLVTLSAAQIADGPLISGSIQAKKRADLRAELPAVVLQVFKDNGDKVRKGEVLLRLDDTSYREAERSAQEAVRAAQVAAQQGQRQLARVESLFGSGAISMQAKEDAQARRDAAQAELAAAQARLTQETQQLARTQITAPFDGIVAQRQVSNGDTAQVGKALLQVIDPSSLQFEGLVGAEQIQQVALNQPVTFYVNGDKTQAINGQVQQINPVADAASRQILVTVGFSSDKTLSAGWFAEGRIRTQQQTGLLLPRGSLVLERERSFVWQLVDNRLQKTPITTSGKDAFTGNFLIQTGVAAGAQVLRNPRGPLQDGVSVRLEKTPASTSEVR